MSLLDTNKGLLFGGVMRDIFLGRRRGEWVAYLRAVHQRDVSRRQGGSDYDDGP